MRVLPDLRDAGGPSLSVTTAPRVRVPDLLPDVPRRSVRPVPGILLGADVAAVLAVAMWLRPSPPGLLLLAVLIATTAATNGYRIPMPPYWLDGLPQRIRVLAVPIAAYLLAAALVPLTAPAALVTTSVGALLLARLLALAGIRTARRRGALVERAVLIGGGVVADRLTEVFDGRREHGVDVVGYVDLDARADSHLPYLGYVQELEAVLVAVGASTVIVTFLSTSDSDLVEELRWTASQGVDVRVVPRMFDVASADADLHGQDHAFGIPLVPLGATPLGSVRWRLKRVFDVTATAAGLLVLWPLLVGLALAVRCSSPGPVLFRQTRIGQHGRPFELLKFRSMAVNDDSDSTWTVRGDGRVTPLGRIMRAYSLDELPQLLNVLRGDMSLVGPRPERPTFVDEFSARFPSYRARHRVPVGVTGWAQVMGLRGDTSIEARARFDNAYVERWSLWGDVTILLRTVLAVVRREG